MEVCPLCQSKSPFTPVTGPESRKLCLCENCKLVFTPPESLPSPDESKARYLLHRNDNSDSGYVRFLMQAIESARPWLCDNTRALDYGCGPSPTLSILLGKTGVDCKNYDLLFFPDPPAGPFDFVFSTETFEHFLSPDQEISLIRQLLRPGGILVVMTEQWTSLEQFLTWHYAHDRTHVIFYHADTFAFISLEYGFDLIESNNPRVTLLRKQ